MNARTLCSNSRPRRSPRARTSFCEWRSTSRQSTLIVIVRSSGRKVHSTRMTCSLPRYKLLDEDDELAQSYRDSFDSVMVDEFQDTDNLQVGIVGKICDEGLTTLATVGDAQQSIYGFRGADLEVYQRMRAMMRERGSNEVELTINYRSQPDILRFVEGYSQAGVLRRREFLKVSSGREEDSGPSWLAPDEPRVKILLSAGHKAERGRGGLRSTRCGKPTPWRLPTNSSGYMHGAPRMVTWRFCSSRRRAPRQVPTCASCAGAAYRSSSRVDPTFLQPEVSTVSMLLRVLADRDDDEALFALLGSGFFDASDDALLALSVINRQCLKLLPGESRAKPSLYDALCLYVEKAQGNLDKSLTRAFDTLEHALSLRQVPPRPDRTGGHRAFRLAEPRWPRVVSRRSGFREHRAHVRSYRRLRGAQWSRTLRRAATFAVSLIWHTRAWLRAPSSERS